MGKYERLFEKLINGQIESMTYQEAAGLLKHLGFIEDQKGRTSGSRVRFTRRGRAIIMHRPHLQRDLKVYQIRQVALRLREWKDDDHG